MSISNKVFGIGFHKTGTSTLRVALSKLGYKVCDAYLDCVESLSKGDLSPILNIVAQYDAFEDNPWPVLYQEMDRRYPGSKFILTIRNEQKWIKSMVNYFGKENTPMREWIYGFGCPKGNEKIYLERYRKHNKEVIEYFKNRPDDLLILSLERGDGWNELCNFLKVPVPDKPFPHVNKSNYHSPFDRTKTFIKNTLKLILKPQLK
jgi:hypothetical protein